MILLVLWFSVFQTSRQRPNNENPHCIENVVHAMVTREKPDGIIKFRLTYGITVTFIVGEKKQN